MAGRRPPDTRDPKALADFGADDKERWESVARHYSKPLRGFFASRVQNPADVDDLVQEVFVQLIRRSRGKPIEHVQQYLFQSAANVLRDHGRRQQARRDHAHEPYDEDLDEAASTRLSPERILLGRESIARVAAALEQLPERTHDVFFLRAVDRCKFADIARMLDVSKSTVEKDMIKALVHLDRVLGESDLDESD